MLCARRLAGPTPPGMKTPAQVTIPPLHTAIGWDLAQLPSTSLTWGPRTGLAYCCTGWTAKEPSLGGGWSTSPPAAGHRHTSTTLVYGET